jgi:heat shock protein HslJ
MHRRLLLPVVCAALAVLVLAGCGAKNQMEELTANPWVAWQVQTSSGLEGTLPGTSPAINFNSDGTVRGNATVNSFRGPYKLDGRSVNLGPLVASEWDGPLEELQQDQDVLTALRTASRYAINNGVLQLMDGSGQTVMNLRVAQEPRLVGPLWLCEEYRSDQGTVVSVVGTSPVGASFAPDGALTGSGGVNSYTSTYKTSGSQMTIAPIVATKMAGPEPAMAQEAAYFNAMSRTASYKIGEFQLTLLDSSGAVLVNYIPWAPK